jgi:hypothetical protein
MKHLKVNFLDKYKIWFLMKVNNYHKIMIQKIVMIVKLLVLIVKQVSHQKIVQMQN